MEAFSGFNDDWDLQFSDEDIEAKQTYEAAPQPMTQPVSQPKTQPQIQPAQQSFDYQTPVVPNTTNNNQNFEPFGQESWDDPMPANNDPFVTDSWDPNPSNIDPFGTESWADQDPYAEVEPEPVQETTYQPQAPKTQLLGDRARFRRKEKEEDVPVPTHTEQRKQKETKANTQRNKKPATVIQSSKATAGSGWKNNKGTSMFKKQPQQRKQAAVRKQQPPKGPRKTQSKQQPARQKTKPKMTQPKAQAPPRQAPSPPALTLESLQKQIFELQARVVELERKQA